MDGRGERLQKVLSRAGVASRREAERLIAAGRVVVDGAMMTGPGTRVDPERDVIEVDGVRVEVGSPRRYLLLYKPAGYLTTVTDPFGRKTVMDLVSDEPPGLFPVGRLDLETEGVLLLTDDGGLANRLTHPRYHVPKTYVALVEGMPDALSLRALAEGVTLEDGVTAPAEVGRVKEARDGASVEITLREGRKRQVRRMFAAIGHPVVGLVRTRFGPLETGGLEPGDIRELGAEEVEALREACAAGE